jgi:ATP-dependent DNA helicase RecQ
MLDNCIYGNYKFLYLSPERLQQELVQNRIQQMNVNLIAVDEAHCISQWGNDFRPAYKNIKLLRQLQPNVNVIALTASATPKVVDDIIENLDFINPKIFKQSFKRDNIAYMVFNDDDKYFRLTQILKKNKQASIVYVRSRKNSFEISNYLEQKGFTSTFYHGGLSNAEKDKHFTQWINNQKQVMVATNAFGMGIDKADVKTVIHVNLPESIESYFQEAGRAGRDGNKAFAIILKNKGDEQHVKHQFLNILPSVEFIKQVYRKLCNYFQISYGEGEFTTHEFNLNAFCKTYKFNTVLTFNALKILDRTSIITLSKQYNTNTSIQIIIPNQKLFNYLEKRKETHNIVKSILRTYGGVFEQNVKINTHLIADKAATTEDNVVDVLLQLKKDAVISLQLYKTDAQIIFLQPREDNKTINRVSKTIIQQNNLKKTQIASVINYANTDDICKSVQLLSYFGENNLEDCGICSVCIKTNSAISEIILEESSKEILKVLKTRSLTSRAILSQTNIKEEHMTSVLKILLEQERIEITNANTYKLK